MAKRRHQSGFRKPAHGPVLGQIEDDRFRLHAFAEVCVAHVPDDAIAASRCGAHDAIVAIDDDAFHGPTMTEAYDRVFRRAWMIFVPLSSFG